MPNRAASALVSRLFRAVAISACCPIFAVHAQEAPAQDATDTNSIDEIVVVVDRDGKPVDIDALRLEETRLQVIRDFRLEQHKQEEELWRQRLRSVMQQKTSRVAWGYDAQSEAARFRYSRANYLPIDRIRPATVISIRF